VTQLQFTAIGTEWVILLDQAVSPQQQATLLELILAECTRFDSLYSRFLPNSWLVRLNQTSGHCTHLLSTEAVEMFRLGLELESLTHGHFTLNIADELAALGYDAEYSLHVRPEPLAPKGTYWMEDATLHLEGRVAFDLGAFGKGMLIDHLAKLLQAEGFAFFLVDGSGDFFGSSKADGSAWTIGLQHPTEKAQLIGTFSLRQGGFASSGISERHWPGGHHLLDGQSGRPTSQRQMAFVAAPSACLADALSTALFVTPHEYWTNLKKWKKVAYCVGENTKNGLRYLRSPDFVGMIQEK